MRGLSCSTARRAAVTIPSPTPAPMEPPMKANSKAATTAGRPSIVPWATAMASSIAVFAWASRSRSP